MVGAQNTHVVAILTRAPSAGGKSRLFHSLGISPDPALLSALLLDTLDGSAVPHARPVIAVTPSSACGEVRDLVGDIEVMAQPEGDLGERMRATMSTLFAGGASAVVLIGSDLPHISGAPIEAAFDVLARDAGALVLGPAGDGGYYLVAGRRVPDIFNGIEWGSAHVLTQTIIAAELAGFRVERVEVLRDVDTEGDLRRAVAGGRAPRTSAWLRRHVSRHLSGPFLDPV
jgi:rSAM/selenodomain-associated transferase 1